MIRLRCNCQNYAWGKIGLSSEVAQLMLASSVITDSQPQSGNPSEPVTIDESQPYAEVSHLLLLHSSVRLCCLRSFAYFQFWMGTHPKGPSVIAQTDELLSKWLADHPAVLGSKFKGASDASGEIQLPFLLKVLSVNTALSIQVHPTKVTSCFSGLAIDGEILVSYPRRLDVWTISLLNEFRFLFRNKRNYYTRLIQRIIPMTTTNRRWPLR